MLTSFESYDALARAGHTQAEIISTITRLARFVNLTSASVNSDKAERDYVKESSRS